MGRMLAVVAGLGAAAALTGGCAIRVSAPIREVAYDFSDRDFYDRGYGTSPEHETAGGEIAPLRQSASARARSLAVAEASRNTPPVLTPPVAGAAMIATPGDEPGTVVLEPAPQLAAPALKGLLKK